jgi:DNA-binding beta-propeller fold protein YncE
MLNRRNVIGGVAALPIAKNAHSSAFARIAVVMNSAEDSLSIIDIDKYTEIERRPAPREPHHWALSPSRSELVIGSSVANALTVLSTTTGQEIRRIDRFSNPYHLLFSPNGEFLVVAELRLDAISIYRAVDFALLKRIRVPRQCSHIVITPDSRFAYVTAQLTGRLVEVDLEALEITWNIEIGAEPAGVTLSANGITLAAAIMGGDYIALIDREQRKIVGRVRTGRGAHAFPQIYDADTLFISNRVENTISQLDIRTMAVRRTFPVPGGPDCLSLSPDKTELWITGRVSNQVMVIDLPSGQLKHRIRVGRSPHGIYLPPSG